jgi:hypothetical protein
MMNHVADTLADIRRVKPDCERPANLPHAALAGDPIVQRLLFFGHVFRRYRRYSGHGDFLPCR